MDSSLINVLEFMFLVICFTSVLSYTIYAYNNFKYTFQRDIISKILFWCVYFVKALLPEQYIIYEKYGIWRYVERLKMKMMF